MKHDPKQLDLSGVKVDPGYSATGPFEIWHRKEYGPSRAIDKELRTAFIAGLEVGTELECKRNLERDDIKELTDEIAALKAERDHWASEGGEDSCAAHSKRIYELEEKLSDTLQVLASHGKHSDSCCIRYAADGTECDCGLYETLKVTDDTEESENDTQDV